MFVFTDQKHIPAKVADEIHMIYICQQPNKL